MEYIVEKTYHEDKKEVLEKYETVCKSHDPDIIINFDSESIIDYLD